MDLGNGLEKVFAGLENYAQTETVVGKPIIVNEVTLLPLIEVKLGVGSSGIHGRMFTAIGGGAKISPSSVLVIRENTVSAISLKNTDSFDKVLELLPEVVGKIMNQDGQIEVMRREH